MFLSYYIIPQFIINLLYKEFIIYHFQIIYLSRLLFCINLYIIHILLLLRIFIL